MRQEFTTFEPRSRRHVGRAGAMTFRANLILVAAMNRLRDAEGIPYAQQIRRGLKLFLESKGVKVKAERRRASTRKGS
jgi:hypothetical protein